MTLDKKFYSQKPGEPDLEFAMTKKDLIYYIQKWPDKIKVYRENLLVDDVGDKEEQYLELKSPRIINEVIQYYKKEKLLDTKALQKARKECLKHCKKKLKKKKVIIIESPYWW
jgi:translation initiation factor 2B subunit (eIF-2B alpha/beta/delta family)